MSLSSCGLLFKMQLIAPVVKYYNQTKKKEEKKRRGRMSAAFVACRGSSVFGFQSLVWVLTWCFGSPSRADSSVCFAELPKLFIKTDLSASCTVVGGPNLNQHNRTTAATTKCIHTLASMHNNAVRTDHHQTEKGMHMYTRIKREKRK